MRSKTIAIVACLIVAFMLAAPAMANRPTPNEKTEIILDDPNVDPIIDPSGLINIKMMSIPLPLPCYPRRMVPLNGDPVFDEGPFPPDSIVIGNDVTCKKQAN